MLSRSLPIALILVASVASCKKASDKKKEEPPKQAPKTTEPTTATKANSLADAGGKYAIDPAHTQVLFKIKHANVSYQYGRFTRVEGTFSIDPANLSKSSIEIEIPTASVFTAVKKRDDHLRSPDFFDAKQFPKITFKSKNVEATGTNTYSVTGDLTMHGVTKEVTLSLEHVGSGNDPKPMGGAFRTGFNGEAKLKRSEWGIKFMLGGGLDDEVTLLLAVEGTRK